MGSILLSANGMAVTTPLGPVVRVNGLYKVVLNEEKSPCRHESGAVVYRPWSVRRLLNPSKFDMKNSRFFPLNSFGIWMGPPRVKPYWFQRNGALSGLVPMKSLGLASRWLLRRNSKTAPW